MIFHSFTNFVDDCALWSALLIHEYGATISEACEHASVHKNT